MEKEEMIYQITDQVLELLKDEIESDIVLKKLEIIKNKKISGDDDFSFDLESILGSDYEEYKNVIINNSIVLEDDKDTEQEELYGKNGKGSIYPYDPSKADIDIREAPQTVYELVVRKWKKKGILIMPDFQRKFVWKIEQQSLFIESILLGFPLPPLYVNKTVDGEYLVVDGRQRLTTLRRFLENEFKLSNLNALPELNNKSFNDLVHIDSEFQTKIEDTKLLVYLIQPAVPLEMVYDIFNRINTGGTQLARQEIRNCIYLGKATELLKKLSQTEYFKNAIDNGISSLRAKDQEAVLRVLSFILLDYNESYKNSMNTFVENAMKKINSQLSDNEIHDLEEKFRTAMITTTDIFSGWANFRIPTYYTRGRINIAVMETLATYFIEIKSETLSEETKELFKEKFLELLNDNQYNSAVRFSTGSTNNVKKRFDKIKEYFDQIKLG